MGKWIGKEFRQYKMETRKQWKQYLAPHGGKSETKTLPAKVIPFRKIMLPDAIFHRRIFKVNITKFL